MTYRLQRILKIRRVWHTIAFTFVIENSCITSAQTRIVSRKHQTWLTFSDPPPTRTVYKIRVLYYTTSTQLNHICFFYYLRFLCMCSRGLYILYFGRYFKNPVERCTLCARRFINVLYYLRSYAVVRKTREDV